MQQENKPADGTEFKAASGDMFADDQAATIETPVGGEAPEENVDPRADILSAIYANRNKALEKELGTYSTDVAGANAPEPEAPAADPAPPAPKEGGTEAPAAPAPATEAKKTKLVVNGQSLEYSDEELVRAAQRGLSADQRFDEAARLRKEAQELLYGATQQQQPQQQRQQQQPASQPNSGSITPEEAKEFTSKLNYGTEDEQAEAVIKLVNAVNSRAAQAQPAYSPQEVVAAATQQALQTIEYRNNMSTIANEFKDVFNDNLMSITAGNYAAQLRQKYAALGEAKPEMEVYREALTHVRDKYLGGTEEPAQPATDTAQTNSTIQATPLAQPATTQARLERKRVAPQPPMAANRVAAEAPANKAPTPSEIVSWMQKTRGQRLNG